jgi:hypothetical protein
MSALVTFHCLICGSERLRAATLALVLAGCAAPAVVSAPGTVTVPLGACIQATADLSGMSLRTRVLTVNPADPAAAFFESNGFLHASLPPPPAVGLRFTYHQEF